MRRRRAAAAADEFRPGLDKPPREFRHIFRRAHIKLAALHIARQACVWLCGQFFRRQRAHFFERRQDVIRAHAAVQADHVDIELVEPRGKALRRSAKRGLAVHLDRHLRDDRQIGQLANSADRLFNDGKLGKGFEHEKIDAAFEQCLGLFLEHIFRFVERGRAERFDPQAERADSSGNESLFAGRLACDPDSGEVHLADLCLKAIRLQFVPRRAEGVRLDDLGTGLDVFFVHLADEVGRGQIKLVVAPVDINALVVKPRADRAVKDVDMFVSQYFAKVLHNEKASPNSETFQIRFVMQLFSGLFNVVASRINSPRKVFRNNGLFPFLCQALRPKPERVAIELLQNHCESTTSAATRLSDRSIMKLNAPAASGDS